MEEKSKLIDSVKKISKDKDIKEAVKLEDSIEYRFKLVEEDALERGIDQGISQGKEETLTDTIKSMLKEKLSYDLISKITGKSLNEIKKIEESLKD